MSQAQSVASFERYDLQTFGMRIDFPPSRITSNLIELIEEIKHLDQVKIWGNLPLSIEIEIRAHYPFAIAGAIERLIGMCRSCGVEI